MRRSSPLLCALWLALAGGCESTLGGEGPATTSFGGTESDGATSSGTVGTTAATMPGTGSDTTTAGSTSTGSADTAGSTTSGPPPSTESGDATDTEGPGSSSGGEQEEYPACDVKSEPQCPEPYDECYPFALPDYSVCTSPCAEPGDCLVPTTGDAVVVCAGENDDQCLLDCSGGETCPDGMECVDVLDDGQFIRCLRPA